MVDRSRVGGRGRTIQMYLAAQVTAWQGGHQTPTTNPPKNGHPHEKNYAESPAAACTAPWKSFLRNNSPGQSKIGIVSVILLIAIPAFWSVLLTECFSQTDDAFDWILRSKDFILGTPR